MSASSSHSNSQPVSPRVHRTGRWLETKMKRLQAGNTQSCVSGIQGPWRSPCGQHAPQPASALQASGHRQLNQEVMGLANAHSLHGTSMLRGHLEGLGELLIHSRARAPHGYADALRSTTPECFIGGSAHAATGGWKAAWPGRQHGQQASVSWSTWTASWCPGYQWSCVRLCPALLRS